MNMSKSEYIKPEIDVIKFHVEDIITNSGDGTDEENIEDLDGEGGANGTEEESNEAFGIAAILRSIFQVHHDLPEDIPADEALDDAVSGDNPENQPDTPVVDSPTDIESPTVEPTPDVEKLDVDKYLDDDEDDDDDKDKDKDDLADK